ncbi:hypothetical protein BUALT_Bualt09G0139200 [Buddleja alternifolia]|uniref:Bromo domain-containing protein n=1 Tax=Buddleja alternifolia TaxID=168488 RepID=A0AAV6X1U7_9LAMI|nr:hypothetical protein BUALT_Bualt09G0139200 [Buddleja alternifolia]
MSRKMRKAMGRDCGRRRSPRISALDAWKQNHHHQETRTIKRRKFDAAVAVSKLGKQVWKGRDGPQNDDHSTDYGKPSIMPAKHILELVLDTLQRRDTYEIFAEPVDPDEVEDYYEIIKEAMDFGTMRAKLHEGMYKNLEEFEVCFFPPNFMFLG